MSTATAAKRSDKQSSAGASETRPEFLRTIIEDYRRKVAHMFLLTGPNDYVVPGLPVRDYLAKVFGPTFPVIVGYSLDEGITFADERAGEPAQDTTRATMRQTFEATLGLAAGAQSRGAAMLGAQQSGQRAPLPTSAREAIALLLKFAAISRERSLVIIDRLDLIVPPADKGTMPEARAALLGMLHRAGTDRVLESSDNLVLMLAPSVVEIHEDVRVSSSGIRVIDIPLPGYEQRESFIAQMTAEYGWQLEMRESEFAAKTAGLYLRHIEDIALRAGKGLITDVLVKQRKREIMASEYAEVLDVLDPTSGFDGHGGHNEAKQYLLDWIVTPLSAGERDMVPLGAAFTGPPGTGKTDLAARVAFESGLNCVLLRAENIKGGIVGESERKLAKALRGIEALAPCLVFIDEIDQKFRRNTGGSGDGGSAVEANQFGRLLEFIGDASHRGRIVFIAATNRPDLCDPALFRAGRFDVRIPLLAPETSAERLDVLRRLLARYGMRVADAGRAQVEDVARRLEGWTGAEIESLVLKAAGLARLRRLDVEIALTSALGLLRRSTRSEYELMTRLAIAECNDLSLLPERYREIATNAEELEDSIVDLRERSARRERSLDI